MLELGVDESGRGSLIGSLVIGFAYVPEDKKEELIKFGIRDAKLLTGKEINESIEFFNAKKIKYDYIEIPASVINRGGNLNLIETLYISKYLKNNKNSFDKVIIDAYVNSRGIKKLKGNYELVLDFLGCYEKLNLVLANKAESKYISVASASIVARYFWNIITDNMRQRIYKDYGVVNLGSLYTPDHKTLRFIRDFPDDKDVRKTFVLSGKNWEKILNERR